MAWRPIILTFFRPRFDGAHPSLPPSRVRREPGSAEGPIGYPVKIKLTKGCVATIDDTDFDLVKSWQWRVKEDTHKSGVLRYAIATIGGKLVGMHNLLVGGRADHRDGDGLNNRRSNLRRCTQGQNLANRKCYSKHGFKGICKSLELSRKNRWHAQITRDRKNIHGPWRPTPEEAARDYDAMARAVHREFATLNFPKRGERSAR
jgi:hypothetical protein